MDADLNDLVDLLPHLLDLLRGSDVRELDVSDGDLQMRLHRSSANGEDELLVLESGEPEEGSVSEPPVVTINSSLVGTFYRAEQPGSAPLVADGSSVQTDTIVGIIEALTVLTEVEAGFDGTIIRVLATDGQPVEYGQPLFEVAPRG